MKKILVALTALCFAAGAFAAETAAPAAATQAMARRKPR